MAKGDTFFLRTTLTSDGTNYVSDNIDIDPYVDPARGRVMVVDRAFITYSTDGQGPIVANDVVSSGTGSKQMGAQVCSEKQTSLVEMKDNSLFARSNIYAAVNPAGALSYLNMTDSLNPTTYVSGFIIPTSQIHCGIATGSAWNEELDVGFLFEVHTEKLSLQRIQELLVSLTAN
tara:strand:- start:2 stop:526 length:525 start_codon:yes stop_codon:yes gene_type:complete